MNKLIFFTLIDSLMEENETIDIRITKIQDHLTVMVVPTMNGKKASPIMSGPPEEIDLHFMDELNQPIQKIRSFTSNAAEVEVEEADEDKAETSETKTPKKNPKPDKTKKAAGSKKSKEPSVKDEDKEEEADEDKAEATEEDEKTDEQVDAELTKEAEEKAAADKLAEEQKRIHEIEEKNKKIAKANELFSSSMEEAEKFMVARKYEDAEYHFKLATLIKPDDKEAQEKLIIATRWVDALIKANIPVERKEVIYNEL